MESEVKRKFSENLFTLKSLTYGFFINHNIYYTLSIIELANLIWRVGRAVEYTSLENWHSESYLGFESLTLRHEWSQY